jgi:hypothetical protein
MLAALGGSIVLAQAKVPGSAGGICQGEDNER